MKPSILIIENNLINRKLTGSLLKMEGIGVSYASDAEKGLVMLTKNRPTLILMGLTLPKMSGLTLTRILKNDLDTSDIIIGALIDFRSSDDFDRSLTEFDGCIPTPINKITFLKKVNYFLENNNQIKNTLNVFTMIPFSKKISVIILAIVFCFNASAITDALKIKLTGSSYSDETVIRFLPTATLGFDASYDAYKMFSTSSLAPSVFTNVDSVTHLCINALPSLISQTDVELFTNVKITGIYSIQSIELGAFALNVKIVLEDKQTGMFYNFRNGNTISVLINFNTIKTANRFVVHFSPPININISNVSYYGLKNGYVILTKVGNHNWNCELKDSKGISVSLNSNIDETITLTGLSAETYTLYSNSSYTLTDTNRITITQPNLTTGIYNTSAPWLLNAYQQDNIIVLSIQTPLPSNIKINIYNNLGSQVYSYSNDQINSLSENIELSTSGNYFIISLINNIAYSQKIAYIK